MAHDDRVLLEQWSKQGDGEAFGALVSRYGGMVYGACRRILGNPTDAEDIAQECFEALATVGTKPGSYVGACGNSGDRPSPRVSRREVGQERLAIRCRIFER